MTRAARARRVLAACLVATLLVPAAAVGDGDPASDVLLTANVFYPYSPAVSPALQRALNGEVAAAGRARFPIKVALIGSRVDLGAIPSLFGRPQQYADFLEREINYRKSQPLLVVMAAGYGVSGLSHASLTAAAGLAKPAGATNDELARAAVAAVSELADADGLHLRGAALPARATTAAGPNPLIIVLLAIAAVGAAVAIGLARRRRA